MSRRISLPGLVAISIAVRSGLARAQVSSGSQNGQIYAGEMFGNTAETTLSIRYQF
jgi:hypothetical protein